MLAALDKARWVLPSQSLLLSLECWLEQMIAIRDRRPHVLFSQVLKADDCIGPEVDEKTSSLKNGQVTATRRFSRQRNNL